MTTQPLPPTNPVPAGPPSADAVTAGPPSADGGTAAAWSAGQIRQVGYRVVDLIADYLTELPDRPVFRPVPPNLARAFVDEPVPTAGADVDRVLEDFVERVAAYPFGNGHPGFYAWVNSAPHVLGVFAEALAAAMNPSVAGGNHAATHVERQLVRWFAELAGFPADSAGLLVSGGSMATLTALTAARHRAAARVGIDVRAAGLQGHLRRFVLYVGAEGHSCAHKAAKLLGLGSAQIRLIGSDDQRRMRPDLLAERLAADRAAGLVPVAVLASVGTVTTGAIDPLAAVADLCAAHDVWLHVDAAYGGPPALLLPEFAATRAALARVDSLALDPHKWLYAPVDAGLVLIRDAALTRDTFSLVPPYLRTDGDPHGVGGGVWFSELGFDQTRPFRALKVWMLLKHLGVDGYRTLIARDLAMARQLAHDIQQAPDLELLAHGLSVVCFRYRPAGWTDGDARLDPLNQRILTAVQLGGRAFLAGATVDGVFVLRACLVNPARGEADLTALLTEVRAQAARL